MTSAIPLWKLAIPRSDRSARAGRTVEVTVTAPRTTGALRGIAASAEATAFRLAGVMPLETGWRCRFELKAEVGTVGDGQVFDLLRQLGRDYAWCAVEKEPAWAVGLGHQAAGAPARAAAE